MFEVDQQNSCEESIFIAFCDHGCDVNKDVEAQLKDSLKSHLKLR